MSSELDEADYADLWLLLEQQLLGLEHCVLDDLQLLVPHVALGAAFRTIPFPDLQPGARELALIEVSVNSLRLSFKLPFCDPESKVVYRQLFRKLQRCIHADVFEHELPDCEDSRAPDARAFCESLQSAFQARERKPSCAAICAQLIARQPLKKYDLSLVFTAPLLYHSAPRELVALARLLFFGLCRRVTQLAESLEQARTQYIEQAIGELRAHFTDPLSAHSTF